MYIKTAIPITIGIAVFFILTLSGVKTLKGLCNVFY